MDVKYIISARDEASAVLSKVQTNLGGVDSAAKKSASSFGSLSGASSLLATALGGISAGLVARELLNTAVASDKLKNSLSAAVGSGNVGAEMQFIREESNRLGLDLLSTAEAYTKLAAGARGTNLEGQATRDIFSAIAEESIVMGLSADDTSGALRAIQQMMSKGKVSAEELRQQLGERLPDAFQLASKAMGVTTADLDKMLERGEIYADDFLPKFAKAIKEKYHDQVVAASKSTQSELGRLNTAWFDLKKQVSDSAPITTGIKAVASSVELMGNNLDIMTVALGAMTASSVISGLAALATNVRAVATAAALGKAGLIGMAAAGGYWIGQKIDEAVYSATGSSLSGRPEYEAAQKREAESIANYEKVINSDKYKKAKGISKDLQPTATATSTAQKTSNKESEQNTQAYYTALTSYEKAYQENRAEAVKAGNSVYEALNEELYSSGKRDYKTYLEVKQTLLEDSLATELAAKKKELAQAKEAQSAAMKDMDKGPVTAKDATEILRASATVETAEKAVATAQKELNVAQIQGKASTRELASETYTLRNTYLSLKSALVDTSSELLRMKGLDEDTITVDKNLENAKISLATAINTYNYALKNSKDYTAESIALLKQEVQLKQETLTYYEAQKTALDEINTAKGTIVGYDNGIAVYAAQFVNLAEQGAASIKKQADEAARLSGNLAEANGEAGKFLSTSSAVGTINAESAKALESGPWGSRGWGDWSGSLWRSDYRLSKISVLPSAASGAFVEKGGLIRVHDNETIVPATISKSSSSNTTNNNGGNTINIYVSGGDKNEIVSTIKKYLARN